MIRPSIRLKGLIIFWSISFLMFLFNPIGYAQFNPKILALTKHIGNGPFAGGIVSTKLDTTTKMRNIPAAISNYIIKRLPIRGKSAKYDPWETEIFFLIGHDKDSIVIITDINNNKDFGDDKIIYYPKKESKTLMPYSVIPLKHNGQAFNFIFQATPYKKSFTYNSAIEEKYYLLVKSYEYLTAEIKNDSCTDTIYISNPFLALPYYKQNIRIALNNKPGTEIYIANDILSFGNGKSLIIDSITDRGDSLHIKEFSANDSFKEFGFSAGLTLKSIKVKDINGSEFTLPGKNKMTLIDFWGTWCVPCKELTPDLKKLSIKHADKVEIVSIAYDRDKTSVMKYIRDNNLKWKHIFESFKGNHNLVNLFNIDTYPTFLLINEYGNILYKGEAKDALHKIDDLLTNYRRN